MRAPPRGLRVAARVATCLSMRMRTLAAVAAAILAACGGNDSTRSGSGSGGASDAGVAGDVVAISLSQTDVHIPVGVTTAFAVTATKADGTRMDVTQQAQATSSNPSVATVAHGQGSQIQISGVSEGTAKITVTYGALQQTCAVTVTAR